MKVEGKDSPWFARAGGGGPRLSSEGRVAFEGPGAAEPSVAVYGPSGFAGFDFGRSEGYNCEPSVEQEPLLLPRC